MTPLAEAAVGSARVLVTSVVMFIAAAAAMWVGLNPLLGYIRSKEKHYGFVLNHSLLLDVSPRVVTAAAAMLMVLLGAMGFVVSGGSLPGLAIGAVAGTMLPGAVVRILCRRRSSRLQEQLVSGAQTLAAGVRAGLNLVQSMQMIARDGPEPLAQEFAHLVREYDYGVPLDEAMDNAARRITLPDFRLLFAALQTHRQRGGNLGETLDRIAVSIREIQRLESRVSVLTAQGRATARWLGAMPAVVMAVLYVIDPAGVLKLFSEGIGKFILVIVITLNVMGFLWIRKIMDIDI